MRQQNGVRSIGKGWWHVATPFPDVGKGGWHLPRTFPGIGKAGWHLPWTCPGIGKAGWHQPRTFPGIGKATWQVPRTFPDVGDSGCHLAAPFPDAGEGRWHLPRRFPGNRGRTKPPPDWRSEAAFSVETTSDAITQMRRPEGPRPGGASRTQPRVKTLGSMPPQMVRALTGRPLLFAPKPTRRAGPRRPPTRKTPSPARGSRPRPGGSRRSRRDPPAKPR